METMNKEHTIMSSAIRIDENMSDKKIHTRVALLEQSTNHVQQSLDRIERRFDVIDKKCERIEGKIDNSFRWLITISISVFFSAASLGFTIYQIFKN